MIELPRKNFDEIPVLADWVELCVIQESSVSKSHVQDFIQDVGIFVAEDAGDFVEESELSENDYLSSIVDNIWLELMRRKTTIGNGYPFRISRNNPIETKENSGSNLSYSFLLLCDLGRRYNLEAIQWDPDSGSSNQRLFEHVVAASLRASLRGTTVRFGWPREPDWPVSPSDRVKHLGALLQLDVEDLGGKVEPTHKDKGLDVVARLSFGDDGEGSIVLLAQCATGKNWKTKKGEPSLTDWQDLLKWKARLERAIVMPWRLERPDTYDRIARKFEAIVIDRPRLAAGGIDQFLGDGTAVEIAQ